MLVADSNYSLGGDNFWLHNGLQGSAAQWWDAKALRPGVNAYSALHVLYIPPELNVRFWPHFSPKYNTSIPHLSPPVLMHDV